MRDNTRLIPASVLITTDRDGKVHEADMLQCVHCGGHFPIKAGSGITRGFCTRCNGPVCGRACAECVPLEKWLEQRESAT